MHRKIIKGLLLALLLCIAAVGIYATDYYHMDDTAAEAMKSSDTITVETRNGMAVFSPADPDIGLVFYPGGKVEYTAYAPLMRTLAENGILCIIPHMPLNLAVTDMHAANDILPLFPQIDSWYIGGHSLGGSMAASHAASCDDFKGLILLAAYSTTPFSDPDFRLLSIYGSNDEVLDMKKYAQYREMFPHDSTEIIFEGGNHAQFGSYGEQEGDGSYMLPIQLQSEHTAVEILKWLAEVETTLHPTEDIHYTYTQTDSTGIHYTATLTLFPKEHRYTLSEPVFSSYYNTGSYTIADNIITATSDDEQRSYRFRIDGDSLFYIGEDSHEILACYAEHTIPVPDGGEFNPLIISA